jgi:D-apiose dehydrogenase
MKIMKGALIGCGFFSRNHLHAWQQLEGVEIVALCDQNAERLAAMSKEFGIEKTYLDANELLNHEALDFVDIATTVPSHRPLVELSAAKGVPIICQKPFASTMEDAHAMVNTCEAAGIPLMVHENFRWQTPVQVIRRLLDEGAIGEPFWGRFSFRSGFDVYRAQPYLAQGKRFIVEDLGIHILDIARYIMGDVESLCATMQRVNPAIAGEDVATMLLRHQGGATSVVDCSYASRRDQEIFPQTLLEIEGRQGSIRLDAGYQLTVHQSTEGTKTMRVEPPLHDWAERPWFNIQDSVVNIQAHWLQCLRKGYEPQTSGRDNLKTLALVEAAYTSAAQHQVVQILQP